MRRFFGFPPSSFGGFVVRLGPGFGLEFESVVGCSGAAAGDEKKSFVGAGVLAERERITC